MLALIVQHYTIPSDNRELQRRNYLQSIILIIPYQVITGNYNPFFLSLYLYMIIPYQVITGNYNRSLNDVLEKLIIPYQVITGNYNTLPYALDV